MAKRYIINKTECVGHDRTHLTEKCNTDDILNRDEADETEWLKLLAEGYRGCQHCMKVSEPDA